MPTLSVLFSYKILSTPRYAPSPGQTSEDYCCGWAQGKGESGVRQLR
jgi:hypothetical protein